MVLKRNILKLKINIYINKLKFKKNYINILIKKKIISFFIIISFLFLLNIINLVVFLINIKSIILYIIYYIILTIHVSRLEFTLRILCNFSILEQLSSLTIPTFKILLSSIGAYSLLRVYW